MSRRTAPLYRQQNHRIVSIFSNSNPFFLHPSPSSHGKRQSCIDQRSDKKLDSFLKNQLHPPLHLLPKSNHQLQSGDGLMRK